MLLLYGLLDRLKPLYNASLPFVDLHIVGTGGSNYFHRVKVDQRGVEDVKKNLVTSSSMWLIGQT